MNVQETKEFALNIRRETVRCIGNLGVGHLGGALSIADLLAVLYNGVFRRADGVIPARLIDEAGLKGLAVNGACVSEKHAGFIVNTGQASAADVAALTEQIIERIFRRYHIQLQPEIEFVSEK